MNADKLAPTRIVGANPVKGRSEMDFYPTPPEVTKSLLNILKLPKSAVIWEPACGEHDMVNVFREAGHEVIATDIQTGTDFLTAPLQECDWIITNPPFSLSDQFIRRCAEHGKPFALLLKSQYWHAKKRFELFNDIQPSLVAPLTWRPHFMWKQEKKGSPLMDVIWCVWEPPYHQMTEYHPITKKE